MRVVIIEDDPRAQQYLQSLLINISPDISVNSILPSIEASVKYFQEQPETDLVFMDTELTDGQCFEIFKQTAIDLPIIFTTPHEDYSLKAFRLNSIDYLLKPIDKEDLKTALLKHRTLKNNYPDRYSRNDQVQYTGTQKQRLLVKKEKENISLKLEDIVLFYKENRVVYVIDRLRKKYVIDQTLSEIESDLSEMNFFRANRQYIVNINFIRSYKSHQKVKLKVDLTLSGLNHCIVISQETAPQFRKWMQSA